ncbi:MAG TPA: nickel-dependent hydrogenase large subunit [Chloroflexota bacterium]|nr:nickel-dependent hydrogenase large subunit [Chloroflexota bacterium]
MCFQNLPIEFDPKGVAYLVPTLTQGEAFAKERAPATAPAGDAPPPTPANPGAAAAHQTVGGHSASPPPHDTGESGSIQEFTIDPVTRIAGALALHATADLEQRRHLDAHAQATLFRGYEVITKGRDPRDAIFITSRMCGVCGGVHSNCAAYAIEMAFGIAPPPMGTVIRNLAEVAEFLHDNSLHLFLLAGPDFSELVVKQSEPAVWEAAQRAEAPNAAVHGQRTIADIMRGLNPLTGRLYLDALPMSRIGLEMYSLLMGKFPHPQTMVPGGVSTTVSLQTFNEYQTRLFKWFDYAKKVALLWNDLYDFLYEANPAYKQVGDGERNLIDFGIWDDPEAYDATYQNCPEWGERRWATPGIIRNGELITTNLQHINIGMEEFVDHSFYEHWSGDRYATDPVGQPISPYHPWNKQTIPRPTEKNWKERYTWATSPRWDRTVMEAGCYARMWTTAVARKIPQNPFIEATGNSLLLRLPKVDLPDMSLEWRVPRPTDPWNAFERNRARAFAIAYTAMVGMNVLLQGFALMRRGETRVSTPFKVPQDERRGVGFWGAGRGFLGHWLVMDKGKITNYQVITPSTLNASPRDPWGQPGPYEASIVRTPILEEFGGPDRFKALDMLRAVRSFDPCMPCTTHVYRSGSGDRLVSRDATSCPCSVEDEIAPQVVTA